MYISVEDFRSRIELSMVSHFINEEEVRKNCQDAVKAKVGVICVNPPYVSFAKQIIGDEKIDLSVNVGFPFGTHKTEVRYWKPSKGLKMGQTK